MADMWSQGERESGTHSSLNFEKKMEEPRKAILAKDWDSFKSFFEKNPKAIMEPLDLSGNTAVHFAAIRWNNTERMGELLRILPPADRWRALRKGDAHNNTVLHQVILGKNLAMVDAVLKEGDDLRVVELVNDQGETPVYRAAKYGKLEMLKRMDRLVDIKNHLDRRQRREDGGTPAERTSILHIAIVGQHFEVALWLISKMEGNFDEVARTKDENGLTYLQLLSKMPSAFRSCDSHMGFTEKLIYACVPVKSYDEGTHPSRKRHRKSGTAKAMKTILLFAFALVGAFAAVAAVVFIHAAFPLTPAFVALTILSVTIRNCTAFAAFLAVLCSDFLLLIPALIAAGVAILSATIDIHKELDRIGKIRKKKKQHMLAEKLADFLVKKDNSWMYSKHAKLRKEVVLPSEPEPQDKEEGQSENPNSSKVYTPLLLAASTGIVEIVKKIIELHPDATSHVSHDEHNILHVTVKHRQKKIYKLLKKYGALESLAAEMSNKGCTLLHHAAMMDHYDGRNQAGAVFQLEEELRWFNRVKKITPSAFVLYRNDDKLTARELFESAHSDMLNKAQEWIKGTAQSCSTVAVLVATVVFPVAYTVPGDYDDDGVPVLLHKAPVFIFFIIMDAVALTSSLLSVITFLSILTSPFQMEEFKQVLPRKLSSGFAWLLISLMATMLAFGSTIMLTFGMKKMEWISIVIYSGLVFPFLFSRLTKYSIFMIVRYIARKLWKDLKEIVPKWLIKLTKPTKERVFSKY